MQFRVWQIVADAFDYCWRERAAVVRFGTIPFLAVLVASGLLHGFFPQAEAPPARTGIPAPVLLAGLGYSLIHLIVYLPMYVTWYRMVVLGKGEAARPRFVLGRREGRMFWWQVLVIVIAIVTSVVGGVAIAIVFLALRAVAGPIGGGVAAVILGVALVAFLLMLVVRLSMASVLVATDQPVSLKVAWTMTRGMGWRLLAAVVLIGIASLLFGLFWRLIAFLVGAVGAMIAGTTVHAIVPYLNLVGDAAAGLIVFLGSATLFGFVYRMLMGQPADAEAASPVPSPAPP